MKKSRKVFLRMDDELYNIIQAKGSGSGLSAKIRNLIVTGLGLEEVNTYREIEE